MPFMMESSLSVETSRPGLIRSSSSFSKSFPVARIKLDEREFKEEKEEQEQEQEEQEQEEQEQKQEPTEDRRQGGPSSSPYTPHRNGSSDVSSSASTLPSPTLSVTSSRSTLQSPGPGPPDLGVADSFAFAFDIDGVLIRGGRPIPEAVEAMRVLNGENEYGVKVPYIFLTNGGGKFETERCNDLSAQLGIEVSPGQFICGHTPMREFADRYGTVLVVGGEGEKCREVAESYGFRDVITPGDIFKANEATAPFRNLTAAEHRDSRDLLARAGEAGLSSIVVEAIFVFADSRDWASDLQIILDLAQSKGGRLETRSETLDEGPPIYFSHNDVLWSAAHEHARLGMGALRHIVETIFESTSGGRKLVTHAFGKPQVSTFEFADRLLRQWREQRHGLPDGGGGSGRPLDTVYFVGDTPESDVRGTNAMDACSRRTEWYSILVKTGVYQEGSEPAYPPRHLCADVLEAVRHGIRREMDKRGAKPAVTAKYEPAIASAAAICNKTGENAAPAGLPDTMPDAMGDDVDRGITNTKI